MDSKFSEAYFYSSRVKSNTKGKAFAFSLSVFQSFTILAYICLFRQSITGWIFGGSESMHLRRIQERDRSFLRLISILVDPEH